jgi:hypothetical protein
MIFFTRHTIHWICDLRDEFHSLCDDLAATKPVAYARFGDGEFRFILMQQGIREHRFEPGLANRLAEIVASKPDYMMGLGWGAVRPEVFEMSRGIDWVGALFLHTALIEDRFDRFFDALADRCVTLTGPFHLRAVAAERGWDFVEVPLTDCWLKYDVLSASLKSRATGTGRVFLFCAGPVSNVFVDDLYKMSPDDSYVDVGSVLDFYAGVRSRRYHDLVGLDPS